MTPILLLELNTKGKDAKNCSHRNIDIKKLKQ